MIKKIIDTLNKFGFVHKSQIDEDYIIAQYTNTIGDPTQYSIDKKFDKEIFENLDKVEGIRDYLKSVAAKDMIRYFQAKDNEERLVIRGGFARTVYFLSRLRKIHEPKDTKIKDLRYK